MPDKPKQGLFKRLFGRGEPQVSAEQPASVPEALPAEAAQPAEAPIAPASAPKPSWWTRLRQGLARSSGSIGSGLVEIFTKRKLDDAMLDELEDILVRADLGVATATKITKSVARAVTTSRSTSTR